MTNLTNNQNNLETNSLCLSMSQIFQGFGRILLSNYNDNFANVSNKGEFVNIVFWKTSQVNFNSSLFFLVIYIYFWIYWLSNWKTRNGFGFLTILYYIKNLDLRTPKKFFLLLIHPFVRSFLLPDVSGMV